MKKTAILLIVAAIALSYACQKDDKKVSTTISGTLIVNGTNEPIRISKELKRPEVVLYHETSTGDFPSGPNWEEVARTSVNEKAQFSITVDLPKDGSYYMGFFDADPNYYINLPKVDNWYAFRIFPVIAGQSNYIKLYVLAHSWVRPRFINTNPDPNNQDMFDTYADGIGPNENSILLDDIYSVNSFFPLRGKVDTLAPWIHKTWSGKLRYGIPKGQQEYYPHEVHGKLTRNGVTRDTVILYYAPPYDTSIVEIRY